MEALCHQGPGSPAAETHRHSSTTYQLPDISNRRCAQVERMVRTEARYCKVACTLLDKLRATKQSVAPTEHRFRFEQRALRPRVRFVGAIHEGRRPLLVVAESFPMHRRYDDPVNFCIGIPNLRFNDHSVSGCQTPVHRRIHGEPSRIRIDLDWVEVPTILVGFDTVECRCFEPNAARVDSAGEYAEADIRRVLPVVPKRCRLVIHR